MIRLSIIVVLPVVSSAVFLSVGPSLVTVGFGSSKQLLSRDFSFRHGGGWKREKERKRGLAKAFITRKKFN